jgi:sugar transferase (PEP-CTERM/EpsH1 system associated)
MNILWIKTELLHPIDKGGRIRTYQMLRALRAEHRITYLTLDNGRAAPDAAERALEYCHELIRIPFREAPRRSPRFWTELLGNVFSPLPYAISKYRSTAMTQAIMRATTEQPFDVAVCDFLAPSQNVPDGLPCRTVLFQHNVEAAIWKRHVEVQRNAVSKAYFREQRRRMERFERRECRRFDRVVAVSRADADTLRRDYGLANVPDVPTGVDTDFFRPSGSVTVRPRSMAFTGAMDWMPNEDGIVWFVDEVLPRIHERVPDASLTVVGRNPPPPVRALAARDNRIRVTGTVPDVRPYMEEAPVFVVPLRVGGGTRLKIFEALAMERALVSTTVGAEGLPLDEGRHAVIADTASAFADAVASLLMDPDRAAALGRAGAAYVREHFGWNRAVDEFVRAINGDTNVQSGRVA